MTGSEPVPDRGASDRDELEACLTRSRAVEVPEGDLCLKVARILMGRGREGEALGWLKRVCDAPRRFTPWQAASALLARIPLERLEPVRRSVRVAVLGSYTTVQFAPMLRLAALRWGVAVDLYECGYGQYRQDALDPSSGLYVHRPDFVVLAVHAGEVDLPAESDDPAEAVEREADGWCALWETIASRSGARIIMHNFAPIEPPTLGHLAARRPGSSWAMLQRLNARLGEQAGDRVSIVDCDRLSGSFGRDRWFDPRYWHAARQAVALDALPELARHTAAVLAADLGLTRKCLVTDLDNTLWGGVIGEDGLSGIRVGGGPEGEAFRGFQDTLLALRHRGVLLAVCSKNNDRDARAPFERHPDMRLSLDDFAVFVADWQPKPVNIRQIAGDLNLGLDALVFVDDNPAERDAVRQALPEVEVVTLPDDPGGFARAVTDALWFETSSLTPEDRDKTRQYRARVETAALERSSASLESFYGSLAMEAVVAPFEEVHLARIVQLIGKTNQFNLTTRRRTRSQVEQGLARGDWVHVSLRLRDRFTDHGLVGVMIGVVDGTTLEIDTWLMSCRVIGRTVEHTMLHGLAEAARARGVAVVRGLYIPSEKNEVVKDLYAGLGFAAAAAPADAPAGTTAWRYDLTDRMPEPSPFIRIRPPDDDADDAA